MKRSKEIVLVLVASVYLSSCSPETQYDVYGNKEDCIKDWNEKECEEIVLDNGTHRFGGPDYYFSNSTPYYFDIAGLADDLADAINASAMPRFNGPSRAMTGQVSVVSARSISIVRGGFGRTGGSFGSGRC